MPGYHLLPLFFECDHIRIQHIYSALSLRKSSESDAVARFRTFLGKQAIASRVSRP